ncbi:leucyl aminopeptidase [Paracidovorax avenae]|uniref:leucyl aminopeptidase n=1 Tax=Paracidovorax avenae TaxID=80867 RepID=UPI000D16265B|nr:leucyl aminopeptidase [Paracidovorax avenae]AVS81205.1 leucyl aminopeptidase [Paracidovorax avenae]AVT16422.1 leucyl aminopeptidase [Paracidovorax avenae]
MNFQLNSFPTPARLLQTPCDCLVAGIAEGKFKGLAKAIDQASQGLLTRLRAEGELAGKAGQTVLLHAVAGLQAHRLLLVGTGATHTPSAASARAAARALAATRAARIVWALGDDAEHWVQAILELQQADYRFDAYRTDKAPVPPERTLRFATPSDEHHAAIHARLYQAQAISHGVAMVRDLGNTPPNVCTPAHLAEQARALGQAWGMEVEVFDRAGIEALGMHSFLAVAQGSVQEPRLIVLRYQGDKARRPPVALVGKGVTFDSGGISLKPGDAMDEMKYDMCGAASVLGTLRACAEMKLKVNLVAVIAACENMPAGNALKPGDVVRSLSGTTIEVLNTDAEGRLILCDALTYAQQRFEPEVTIDVATLTGACVIALGHVRSGLYANDDALGNALVAAGDKVDDPAWRMPLDAAYQEQLKSPIADLANIGGRAGGSVTAACFLSRFVQGRWAHLDIAGTAWKSGKDKGGTGRPVPLLAQYLIDRTAP